MHLGDSIFIFLLALVLLGPRRLPEAAKQVGKLLSEFRRASNDFKYQLNEELRTMEQQEQQKKQEAERARLEAERTAGETPSETTALPASVESVAATGEENTILPPDRHTTELVVAEITTHADGVPYAISATTGEEHPVEEHPLLKVDEIPPMDAPPFQDPTVPPEEHAREETTLHHD